MALITAHSHGGRPLRYTRPSLPGGISIVEAGTGFGFTTSDRRWKVTLASSGPIGTVFVTRQLSRPFKASHGVPALSVVAQSEDGTSIQGRLICGRRTAPPSHGNGIEPEPVTVVLRTAQVQVAVTVAAQNALNPGQMLLLAASVAKAS